MLRGRAELAHALQRHLAERRPAVVVGEAGIGKTALVREVCGGAGRPVYEGGALSTLQWMDNLALRRALGRPVRGSDAESVAADVESAVGDGILVLDDLQWADEATRAVTELVAGRISIVAAVRTGDPGTAPARDWLAGAGFVELEVGALDAGAATAVVRDARPDLSAAAVTRTVERAGGNPLLLGELAATGEPSDSLKLALNARLRQLPEDAREAFALLALAGRPLPAEAIGAATARVLVEGDLAVGERATIAIRHALLGEVVVADLDEQRRVTLHARLARLATDDGERARHHLLAGEPELAHAAALRAAETAARPGERASHLAIAAACAGGPEADRLRMQAAWSLHDANDWPRMIETLRAIGPADVELRAEAALLRARGAWAAGDAEEMRAALTEGLAAAAGTHSAVEVRLRIEQSRIPIFLDTDYPAGVRAATEALQLATTTGVDVARAHYLLGTALGVANLAGWDEQLTTAVRLAAAAGDTQTEFNAASNLIGIHEMAGSHAAGRDAANRALGRARDLGYGYWETALGAMVVNLDCNDGRYPEAIGAARALLDRPLDARARDVVVEAMGIALIDLGRIDEAVRLASASLDSASPDFMGQVQLEWVLAEAALWDGQPARALELVEVVLDKQKGTVNTPLALVTRSWACADLGRDPGPGAPPEDRPFSRAAPHETRALHLAHAGAHAAAADEFAAAATQWTGYHLRGELRCRWAQADALRRLGDPAAVALLEAVEQRTADCGMTPLLGRIRRSLRAAGQRRSVARAPGAAGPAADLSARESELVHLVAAGLTNDQIAARLGIARRTVETHLASASAKLGARTRSQLAALARRADAD